MAKIPRIFYKIFGIDAPASQIAKFGSLAQGNPEKTKDLTAIQQSFWKGGLYPATENKTKPPAIEDINAVLYHTSSMLAYLFQEGVPEYDNETVYYHNSFVKYGNRLYFSSANNFSGNAPLLDDGSLNCNYWRCFDASTDEQPAETPVESSDQITAGTITVLDWLKKLTDNTAALFAATASLAELKADIDSPALTGVPTAPTPAPNAYGTEIATMAAVRASIGIYSYPVGAFYTQYAQPGETGTIEALRFPPDKHPAALFGGSWAILYNGDSMFFRTEGENAQENRNPLNAIQPDAIRNITANLTSSHNGFIEIAEAFYGTNEWSWNISSAAYYSSGYRKLFFDASRVVPVGSENRPINALMRIYQRIS